MNMRQRKRRISVPLLMRGRLMVLHRGVYGSYAYWGHFIYTGPVPTHSRRKDRAITVMWNMTAEYRGPN